MSAALGILSMGRVQAESLMVTECIISRATGDVVTDDNTLEETPVMAPVYTGKCRLKFAVPRPFEGDVPGEVVTTQHAEISLPIEGSETVTTGDVWECTASPTDPALVGRTLRITGHHAQTFATARRFPAEEVS